MQIDFLHDDIKRRKINEEINKPSIQMKIQYVLKRIVSEIWSNLPNGF